MIVVAAVVVVAIAAAVLVFLVQGVGTNTAAVPDVKFVSFDADRKDIPACIIRSLGFSRDCHLGSEDECIQVNHIV